jgi:26S proteasome regulatory subunit N8
MAADPVEETAKAPTPTAQTGSTMIQSVAIHPLVLLSAADYHRVARGTRKRVVGVLLGSVSRGKVDATNSFAVPFEEDSRNPVSTVLYCME